MSNEATQALEPVQDETPMETSNEESSQTEGESEPTEDVKQDDAPADNAENTEPSEAERVKQSMQKRINQMRAKNGEYERRMQDMADKLAQLEKAQGPQAPREDDFESVEEYLIAKGKFEAQREIQTQQQEEQKKLQEQRQREEQAKVQATFDQRVSKFKENASDFDEVSQDAFSILESENSLTSQALAHAFIELENGPALLYQLGKNPDVFEDVVSASPVEAIFKLAQLENSLSAAPQKTQPKPVNHKPVKSSAGKSEKTGDVADRILSKLNY